MPASLPDLDARVIILEAAIVELRAHLSETLTMFADSLDGQTPWVDLSGVAKAKAVAVRVR